MATLFSCGDIYNDVSSNKNKRYITLTTRESKKFIKFKKYGTIYVYNNKFL